MIDNPAVSWRKSSFSGGANSSCVEIARVEALVGVRDSKNSGPVLTFSDQAFLTAVRSSWVSSGSRAS
jgi:hypothetical protein